jgi:hypothetical protein
MTGGLARIPYYALRAALRERAGEPPLDQEQWPRGKQHDRMPALSAAEHFALGADLKRINADLVHVVTELGNYRPRTTAQANAFARARKAVRQLDTLRAKLDNCICRDHPNDFRGQPPMSAYYGTVPGPVRRKFPVSY